METFKTFTLVGIGKSGVPRSKHTIQPVTAPQQTYSTAEVARMWAVSESSVKRWSDSGALACIRTPGGHRRFTLQALLDFQQAGGVLQHSGRASTAPGQGDEVAATDATSLEEALAARDWAALQARYYEVAVAGDEPAGVALLERAYRSGIPVVALKEHVLTPVLHLIGERWRRGELNIWEEHLASQVTLAATEHLHRQLPRAPFNGRLALCGCPEGDLHEIALHLVVELLEVEGWRVLSLGPNTPLFSFADAVRRFSPQLVCISATIVHDLERLRRDYGDFYHTARQHGARIVIGGAAFADPQVREIFIHDYQAAGLTDFLDYLRREFPTSDVKPDQLRKAR
ncbi:putative cobalamin binding protein [Chloracidobacterium thermophilum B]|uniref:Putative cobalamin binding protein n=1 Tax=Chloracidobacterium thermophilum (strain B) TaxID=981222 RepID=G2LGI2_CHLTF|nr:putative cobalamin binding protein [Chloracidobacterium thermophilum B]